MEAFRDVRHDTARVREIWEPGACVHEFCLDAVAVVSGHICEHNAIESLEILLRDSVKYSAQGF
jgi:hypothetical protein